MSRLVGRTSSSFRRVLFLGVIGAVLAAAFSGCGGEVCSLKGTANFSPGLKLGQKANTYTFNGSLSGCSSVGRGDPELKSATISASGSGKLSCSTGPSKGTATINWNTGETSTVSFTTNGALNAVTVS